MDNAIEPAKQIDLERIAAAVREILAAVGEDPDREGLRATPMRVARMYAELFSGLREDPAVHLRTTFTEAYDEMVVLRDIQRSENVIDFIMSLQMTLNSWPTTSIGERHSAAMPHSVCKSP